MKTRNSKTTLDPLSPLPPSTVQPPRRRNPPRQGRTAPPPPPPPLPATAGTRTQPQSRQSTAMGSTASARGTGGESNIFQVDGPIMLADAETCAPAQRREWVLKCVIPRVQGKSPTQVQVKVTTGMNPQSLSTCLEQACTSVRNADAASIPHPIVGLFIHTDTTGTFVSLDHILKNEELHNEVFGLGYSPPPSPIYRPPPLPWYSHPLIVYVVPPVLFSGGAFFVIWYHGREMIEGMQWLVEAPLRKLYRKGPWFIGWESATLPSICARITYYGDASFWYRNMAECEGIYASKEDAFLHISLPIAYSAIGALLIWLLIFLYNRKQQMALHRSRQRLPQPDQEMVETYNAMQTLLRNIRGNLEPRQREYPVVDSQILRR